MTFLSRVLHSGDGTTKVFTFNIPYISRAHVKAFVGGVETTAFSFNTSTQIAFTDAPADGTDNILLRRVTPSDRLVDYEDGANITAAKLDKEGNQFAYLYEEAQDAAASSIGLDSGQTAWDADSKRVTNVADATAAQDAVTKSQLDAASMAAGNVQTPDALDDGKLLTAGADGTWSWASLAYTALTGFSSFVALFLSSEDQAAARLNLGLATVPEGEAVEGTAQTDRVWTAQRVRQAVEAVPTPVRTQQLFTASGTWTKPTGCVSVTVEIIGAGGGGGSAGSTGASQASSGGGGAAGGYLRKVLDVTAIVDAALVVGAGGPGGASGVNDGTAGGATTWDDGVNSLSVPGGLGGKGIAGTGTPNIGGHGGSGVLPTGGDVNAPGGAGGRGVLFTGGGTSGIGGDSAWAGGGNPPSSSGSGTDGAFPGGGGSGGAQISASSSSNVGGDGAGGLVLVTEYYD